MNTCCCHSNSTLAQHSFVTAVFIYTELMYSSDGLNQRPLVSNSKFSCWHRRLNGSAGPSLQAAIQLHTPATVLCSATDLFGLLGGSTLHTASAILSPGSLMVRWPSQQIQNIQNSSQSTFSAGGQTWKETLLNPLFPWNVELVL